MKTISRKEFATKFFKLRFKRRTKSDKDYFDEWIQRFKSGHQESYMDIESLKVYNKLKTKYKYV